jgi:hypothetical protein
MLRVKAREVPGGARSVGAHPSLAGRLSTANAPPSAALPRVTRPWCSSAISFTNDRPRPVLFFCVCGRASE